MTSETIISTMLHRIVEPFHPSRVLLFGSRARGTATESSDVDLLVALGDVSDKRHAAVEIRRALGDLSASKDIMVTTPNEIALRGDVVGTALHAALREGVTVYERP